MSISEKQLKANRKNAKKGGVKTQKGKAVSRLNATKHAMLLSVQIVIPGEDIKEFLDFQKSILTELAPSGVLEDFLVDRFLACAWRLRRILSIESTLFLEHYPLHPENSDNGYGDKERTVAERLFIDNSSLEKVMRYETMIERQMYKAMAEFIELRLTRRKLSNAGEISLYISLLHTYEIYDENVNRQGIDKDQRMPKKRQK